MARIRSIHPGLWTDEAFVSVSPTARLLFLGLWNEADDNGVFAWKPLTLKMRLMPADAVDVAALLEEVRSKGMVMQFEAEGRLYGAIRNFREFQKPEKPRAWHPITEEAEAFSSKKSNSNGGSDKRFVGLAEPSPSRAEQSVTGRRMVGDRSESGSQKFGLMEKEIRREDSMPDFQSGDCVADAVQPDLIKPEPVREVAAKPKRTRADREEPEGFAEFYRLYPRHEGRAKAAQAFPAAVRAAGGLEALVGHLRAFAFGPDKKFHPHPATWLNERRWRDREGVPASAAQPNVPAYDERYFDLEPDQVAKLPKPRVGSPEYNAWTMALEGKTWPRPGSVQGGPV